MRKLITILFLCLTAYSHGQTWKDTTIAGDNAVIFRPAEYYTTLGNADSTLQCIVFMYGYGEISASYSTLRSIGGPIAYMYTGGFDGRVGLPAGDTLSPIVIGLRCQNYYTVGQLKSRLDAIKTAFKIKVKNLHIGGFSMGGDNAKLIATEDNYDSSPPYGPFTYADGFRSIVDVMGVIPDDNSEWYQKVKNFARNIVGGKYFGLWGTGDGERGIGRFGDTMNAVSPGSASVQITSDNHSWTAVHRVWGNPSGTAPQTWSINGRTLNVWQWVLLQGEDTTEIPPASNYPPSVNAGSDSTILFIASSIQITGSASDPDGSVVSHTWTKISGPSCTITSPSSYTTTITGMSYGTYVFRLTATDDDGDSGYDERVVYNGIPCNQSAGIRYTIAETAPGEIYITNGSARGWKGGDTLDIPAGTYSVLEIDSFGGDPCRRIYIRNVGGQVVVTGSIRFKADVHYVDFIGDGHPGTLYGFKAKNVANTRTAWFTMRRVDIGPNPSGTGIYWKQDPTGAYAYSVTTYINRKVWIDSCRVTNVDGEGMYIGHTYPNGDPSYSYNLPQRFDSVTISNCIVDSTGWDGIQLSNARDGCLIYNNTVTNFGLLDLGGQRAGIISGGNTNSKVYSNVVRGGYGNGIQFFGYGTIEGYNNSIYNVGNTADNVNGEQSFFSNAYVNDYETNPGQTIYLHDNFFHHPKLRGAIQVDNTGGTLDTVTLENNRFCFVLNPGVDWKDDYIVIPTGYTDTNNTIWCSSLPLNGLRLRIKIKQH